jgi:flavin-dependent dehydrogenase
MHTDRRSIYLTDSSTADPELSLVTRRVFLDGYLLAKVEKEGIDIFPARVTDMEFNSDRVNLYAENGSFEGDILVGAFGLDRQMCEALERKTGYRPPDSLETVVTKMHPGQELVNSFGDQIHAFLPRRKDIEFAALVPKGDHITAIAAGRRVTSSTLREFLASPACLRVLKFPFQVTDVFKGNFPICPAKHFYGDRYITIGDSAGLVRPFKGKGINTAIISGYFAAKNILERGISRKALSQIENDFAEQIGDLWYGRTARWMANYLSRFSAFDPVLEVAENDQDLRQALFDSISAHDTYHNIFKRLISSPSRILKLARAFGYHFLLGGFLRDAGREGK